MRASGVRGLLIYCADYRCSHHVATAKTLNLAIPPNLLARSGLRPRLLFFAISSSSLIRVWRHTRPAAGSGDAL